MATSPVILCLNSGSSSLKFALYQLGEIETLLATGVIERIGLPGGQLWVHGADEKVLVETHSEFPTYSAAGDMAFEVLEQWHLPQPTAVGHRLVHGGPEHVAPEHVTPQLISSLYRLVAFAPLHLPGEIQGIEGVACLIKEGHKQTRTFATLTADLLAWAEWLMAEGCTYVAIESTGGYWRPVFNLLEGQGEVILVTARHSKAVPGRKTDVRDSEWLAEWLRHEEQRHHDKL
jgi:acetokinase family protein/transposase